MYQTIRYEKQENIGILTINRPEALNALNSTVISDLEQVIAEVEKDAELLYEIKDLLDEHIAADSAKSEAMKCLLRDSITGIYYKHLKEGELHAYELEDLTHLYDSYKKLGGNSYVENIYKQMTEEWTVTG